jgi:hypothetical protein
VLTGELVGLAIAIALLCIHCEECECQKKKKKELLKGHNKQLVVGSLKGVRFAICDWVVVRVLSLSPISQFCLSCG